MNEGMKEGRKERGALCAVVPRNVMLLTRIRDQCFMKYLKRWYEREATTGITPVSNRDFRCLLGLQILCVKSEIFCLCIEGWRGFGFYHWRVPSPLELLLISPSHFRSCYCSQTNEITVGWAGSSKRVNKCLQNFCEGKPLGIPRRKTENSIKMNFN